MGQTAQGVLCISQIFARRANATQSFYPYAHGDVRSEVAKIEKERGEGDILLVARLTLLCSLSHSGFMESEGCHCIRQVIHFRKFVGLNAFASPKVAVNLVRLTLGDILQSRERLDDGWMGPILASDRKTVPNNASVSLDLCSV